MALCPIIAGARLTKHKIVLDGDDDFFWIWICASDANSSAAFRKNTAAFAQQPFTAAFAQRPLQNFSSAFALRLPLHSCLSQQPSHSSLCIFICGGRDTSTTVYIFIVACHMPENVIWQASKLHCKYLPAIC